MTLRGVGSISSPIIISDDEDEAFVESQLTAESSSLNSAGVHDLTERTAPLGHTLPTLCAHPATTGDLRAVPSEIAKSVGYSMALRMGFRPGHGLGFQLDGRVEPVSMTIKRKRTDSGIGFQGSPEDLESRLQNGPSKVDRKKPKQDPPPKAKEGKPVVVPPSPNGKGKAAAVPLPASEKQPQTPTPVPALVTFPSEPGQSDSPVDSDSAPLAVPFPHPLSQQHYQGPFSTFSPYLGPALQEMWPPPWFAYPTPPMGAWDGAVGFLSGNLTTDAGNVPTIPLSLNGGDKGDQDTRLQQMLQENYRPPTPRKPSAKQLKNVVSIGRGPETDPQGIYGAYTAPLLFLPNPSCTLVLDGIPARFRSAAWLQTWAANASQLPAWKVDIDVKNGKGLVEFPDAVTAQKAFNSKQLKGKGKHSIRAWWYRPPKAPSTTPNVATSNGKQRELEEGEIVEISASEAVELAVPRKKLTRAQRRIKQRKLAAGQGSSQTAPPSGLDGPLMTEHVLPCISQVAGALDQSTGVEPVDIPQTDAQFPVVSSVPSSATIRCPSRIDEDDASDVDMSSPFNDSTDIPPDVDSTTVETHATFSSTEPVQSAVVIPLSADDKPLSTSQASDVRDPISSHPPTAPITQQSHEHNDNNMHDPILTPKDSVPPSTAETSDTSTPIPVYATIPAPETHAKPSGNCSTSRPPSRIPSEPRSFRNPPVAPSFTKRTLLARQKELEDRINQSKLALGQIQKSQESPPLLSAQSSSSATPTTSTPPGGVSEERLNMEQDLRRLVLQSKKSRTKLPTPSTPSDPPTPKPSVPNNNPPALVDSTALEQLAVSFITESIETVRRPVTKEAQANTREQLALKQQRLERYIAESKVLMARLAKASSKEEKDTILAAMRECSRMMEPDSPSAVEEKTTTVVTEVTTKAKPFLWPSSCEDSLEISDDEE
ncbi:hypothetical protein ID866_4120 [Astraeus odoratus]|nr:hypothetical protein ID866_4120 [Astraeus odoratus]